MQDEHTDRSPSKHESPIEEEKESSDIAGVAGEEDGQNSLPVQQQPSKVDAVEKTPSRTFQKITGEMTAMMMHSGAGASPLFEKIDSTHIHKIIDKNDEADKRDHESQKDQQKKNFWVAISALVFVLILCFLFLLFEKSDQLDKVLAGIIGFFGGFGVGSFYSKRKSV